MFDLIDMFLDWTMLMFTFMFAIGSTLVVVVLTIFAIHIALGGKIDFQKNTSDCNCSQQTAEANP